MEIRPEREEDHAAIAAVTAAAFASAAHYDGTEPLIAARLREAAALTLSLVAIEDGIVGHLALSPVTIDGAAGVWFGLGPVAVRPDRQGQGIGSVLINTALRELGERGAAGCVVLGDPDYYGRFGFEHDPGLVYADVPPPFFQRLVLAGPPPVGRAHYHPAFGAEAAA